MAMMLKQLSLQKVIKLYLHQQIRDLELYTCDIDGSNLNQVTNQLGYDGGAFLT